MPGKKYTKELLIELIQQAAVDGSPPKCEHANLPRRSVFNRYFGSWRGALLSAGFSETYAEANRPEERKIFGPEYKRQWYQDNKKNHIASATARNVSKQQIFTTWKNTLECYHCGENFTQCLQFHHIDGTKEFTLSGAAYKVGTDTLLLELNKCGVVCGNCHVKVHEQCLSQPKKIGKRKLTELRKMLDNKTK